MGQITARLRGQSIVMASQRKPAERRRPAPRLYLVAPPAEDVARLTDSLADALAAGDVAAVLLRLQDGDERTLITSIKAIASIVQANDSALLLDGHPDLVASSGADGAHLTGIDAFLAAITGLKPDRIAGCGGTHTRHDAMLAAESGADYLMFGKPDADGGRPSFDTIVERVAWWAEVFEIPCVGFAASLDEVEPLAASGAEFVALGDWAFADERGIAATVRDAIRRLAVTEIA
jgi:thiamine-phosphate pyrophosphorylase